MKAVVLTLSNIIEEKPWFIDFDTMNLSLTFGHLSPCEYTVTIKPNNTRYNADIVIYIENKRKVLIDDFKWGSAGTGKTTLS